MKQKKENKKKRWKAIIITIIAFLLLLTIIVFAPRIGGNIGSSIPSLPGINRSIISKDWAEDKSTDNEINIDSKTQQQEVLDNTLNARIASALKPTDEGLMYLSLKNKYEDKLLQVVIVDQTTKETYYTSHVIEPLNEVEYDRLSTKLVNGEYECIAYFYYYTLNEEPISQVGAKIKLIVQ